MSPLCVFDCDIQVANRLLIHNLNFSVQEAEILVVLGPTGSGKTRLLETLAGLWPCRHGEIFLGGKGLAKMPMRRRARRRGLLLPVDSDPFPMTVRQRILGAYTPHRRSLFWSSRRADADVNHAMAMLDLTGRGNERLDRLNRRELRCVDLASLVVQRPRLWLLDEPNNYLDHQDLPRVMDTLISFIRDQRAGAVITLHDTALAQRHADQVMMLTGRGDFELGAPDQMLTHANLTTLAGRPVIDADRDSALP